MKAGMGDGGGCHPRDNIALRYMAENLGLGYDLFDAIMNAREKQAKNLAETIVKHAKDNRLPVAILGKAYKPDVHYEDGSTSILTGHYIEQHYGEDYRVTYDPIQPFKAVYLLGHMGKHHDFDFPDGSIIIDPWRAYPKDNENLTVIHYGNTRFSD
jgi:UDPglucose 6-dehydrogenase